MEKLFRIYAYAKAYDAGFEPIICTEQAKDEYLDMLRNAIKNPKLIDGNCSIKSIRNYPDRIEFDGVTLSWEEVEIARSFKELEIELINFNDGGYQDTWLNIDLKEK